MQKPNKFIRESKEVSKSPKSLTRQTSSDETPPPSQSTEEHIRKSEEKKIEDKKLEDKKIEDKSVIESNIKTIENVHSTNLSQSPSIIDDHVSNDISRPSVSQAKKSHGICPPALQDRGYEINEEIGGGAFSKVYRAKYKILFEKDIAVKVIALDKVPEFWREKCLKQELKIIRKLQHPHIIKVWDIIKTRRNVFIFMDLAENNSILHYLNNLKRPIPEPTARFWFIQTTGAISYMHSKGIAHRDLKLENILLDRDYNAKITDFGFSCFTYDKDTRQALMSPTQCGTQAYTAPEVYTPPYEARIADIWSLGICLFEMVTGQKPFEENINAKKFIKQLCKRDYKYPSGIDNKLTDELKDIISKMLEPDTELRITANQVLTHPWILRAYSPRKDT